MNILVTLLSLPLPLSLQVPLSSSLLMNHILIPVAGSLVLSGHKEEMEYLFLPLFPITTIYMHMYVISELMHDTYVDLINRGRGGMNGEQCICC